MSGALKTITGLFSPPKQPKAAEPIAMPDPNSAEAKAAAVKRNRIKAKAGREGTIYSQSYSGTSLGGT